MPSFAHLAVFAVFSGAMATSTPSRRHGSELLRRASHADFLCLAFNLNTNTTAGWDGSPLVRSGTASHGPLLQCTYADGDSCTYSPGNGSMSTGSKTCPSSIDAFKSFGSHFDCQKTDTKQSALIGTSITPTAENLACVYGDGALCTYSQFAGTLSTGDSHCPLTAASSAGCPVSSSGPTPHNPSSASRNLLSNDISSSSGGALSPALITLITLNSVLVLAVLILGGLWFTRLCWRSGTGEAKYRTLSLGNVAGAGAGTKGMRAGMMGMPKDGDDAPDGEAEDDMPRTHGAPGRYEDEPFMCSAAPRS